MDQEVLDVVRPILIMGGAMTLVMMFRELHRGWVETITARRLRQRAKDRQKLGPEDEADPE